MSIEQITLFLENSDARLTEVTELLAEHCINIKALSLAGENDTTVLRLIVNDTDKALQLFRERGFNTGISEVLAMEVIDRPGGLATVLSTLHEARLAVACLTAFSLQAGKNGLVILRTGDQEKAKTALQQNGIHLLSAEELFTL